MHPATVCESRFSPRTSVRGLDSRSVSSQGKSLHDSQIGDSPRMASLQSPMKLARIPGLIVGTLLFWPLSTWAAPQTAVQVSVIVGSGATDLERFAASQLCVYLEKLFGIQTQPPPTFRTLQERSFSWVDQKVTEQSSRQLPAKFFRRSLTKASCCSAQPWESNVNPGSSGRRKPTSDPVGRVRASGALGSAISDRPRRATRKGRPFRFLTSRRHGAPLARAGSPNDSGFCFQR